MFYPECSPQGVLPKVFFPRCFPQGVFLRVLSSGCSFQVVPPRRSLQRILPRLSTPGCCPEGVPPRMFSLGCSPKAYSPWWPPLGTLPKAFPLRCSPQESEAEREGVLRRKNSISHKMTLEGDPWGVPLERHHITYLTASHTICRPQLLNFAPQRHLIRFYSRAYRLEILCSLCVQLVQDAALH